MYRKMELELDDFTMCSESFFTHRVFQLGATGKTQIGH